jgi:hypothetical protein
MPMKIKQKRLKIIDKAFRIVKSNDNEEEIESENKRDRKKRKIESPKKG